MAALEIVEAAEELGLREVDADLLEGLALGSVLQTLVGRFDPPARKRHVTRPRISLTARPFDQQHLGRRHRLPQQHRHGRLAPPRLGKQVRRVAREGEPSAREIDHAAQDSSAGRGHVHVASIHRRR